MISIKIILQIIIQPSKKYQIKTIKTKMFRINIFFSFLFILIFFIVISNGLTSESIIGFGMIELVIFFKPN